jgi:hypothetical protein
VQSLGKRTLTVARLFSVGSMRRLYNVTLLIASTVTRVEAGSNTSTVTLRVVGGDEEGNVKSETVKDSH